MLFPMFQIPESLGFQYSPTQFCRDVRAFNWSRSEVGRANLTSPGLHHRPVCLCIHKSSSLIMCPHSTDAQLGYMVSQQAGTRPDARLQYMRQGSDPAQTTMGIEPKIILGEQPWTGNGHSFPPLCMREQVPKHVEYLSNRPNCYNRCNRCTQPDRPSRSNRPNPTNRTNRTK